MNRLFSMMALLIGLGGTSAYGAGLPILVDGAPWQAVSTKGATVQMTFRPDGTGQLKSGALIWDLTWALEDGAFCIDGVPGRTARMNLSVRSGKVIGTSIGGGQIIFKRA
jgi:hypothetical protein